MATTVTTEAAMEGPRTIQLVNGNRVTAHSNQASKAESIPMIDVSRMYSPRLEDRRALAEEIREASRNIGFFLITNHVRASVALCAQQYTHRL